MSRKKASKTHMNEPVYKYDVAFSFLEQDKHIAVDICDKIQDRHPAFIYTKKQEVLTGRDGEDKFSDVFGKESRIVVIVYRDGWGETPWTRIEQTAIRNRGHEDGYEFTLFVLADKKSTPPRWLPKAQIWHDLERWGIEGVAAVIESKIKEHGGDVREESIEQCAERLQREVNADNERKSFLASGVGVQKAKEEIGRLFSETKKIADTIGKDNPAFKMLIDERERDTLRVICGDLRITFHWGLSFANTLKGSRLYFSLTELRGLYDKEQILETTEYHFDRNLPDSYVWRSERNEADFHTTDTLSSVCIKKLLKKVQEHIARNN